MAGCTIRAGMVSPDGVLVWLCGHVFASIPFLDQKNGGACRHRLAVNLECKVADARLVNKYNLFVLEVLKAWTDPTQKNPKTIHHHGYGRFAVDGEMIKLKSRMR